MWLDEARTVIDGYFAIEQPSVPAALEQRVTTTTRAAASPRFHHRVTSTGVCCGSWITSIERHLARATDEALYQLGVSHALLLARTRRLPSRMQLVYLKAGPGHSSILRPETSRTLSVTLTSCGDSIARDIENDLATPRKNPSNWCGANALPPYVWRDHSPPRATCAWLSRTRRLDAADLKQCGRTGLYLSAIGIGTLTWGRDTAPKRST